MRGRIEGVPPLLQPVAHTLLQIEEDLKLYTSYIDDGSLWSRPSGVASVGFHLLHIPGVIDRMFTYALGLPLTEQQFSYLRNESLENDDLTIEELLLAACKKIQWSINQLRETDESLLTETRYLGRNRIPTTLIGLLFHAAEHTQRHIGQMLVTIRVIQHSSS